MTLFINRTTPNGDLTLLSGEIDEVNYPKLGANLAVTTAVEFDEVTIGSVVNGLVRKDFENGSVAIAGALNEADYYDEALFTVPGTYQWTCPFGVTSVSVVCVGGGGSGGIPGFNANVLATGGGGGALSYRNNISVVPGTTYTVVVGAGGAGVSTSFDGVFGNAGGDSWFLNQSTVLAQGGHRGGITPLTRAAYVGDGGGRGGLGGTDTTTVNEQKGGGGGGAGGYAGFTQNFIGQNPPGIVLGDGGNGASGQGDNTSGAPAARPATNSGGAAGGAAEWGTFNGNGNAAGAGGGGGGVDVFGQGADGSRFINVFWDQNAPGGGGGSGGSDGGSGDTGFAYPNRSGAGGTYGGGSGAATGVGQSGFPTISTGKGGDGAVRILWSTTGLGRSFPSTNVGRSLGFRPAETFTYVFVASNTYSTNWNTQLVQRVQFTWADALALQQFFQLGSYINLVSQQTGTQVTTKDTAWANLIDSLGNTNYTADNFFTGGNVVIREQFSGGSYSSNFFKAWGEKFTANNSIVISAIFDDNSLGTNVDTLVTLSISHTTAYYRAQSPVAAVLPQTTVLKLLSPP